MVMLCAVVEVTPIIALIGPNFRTELVDECTLVVLPHLAREHSIVEPAKFNGNPELHFALAVRTWRPLDIVVAQGAGLRPIAAPVFLEDIPILINSKQTRQRRRFTGKFTGDADLEINDGHDFLVHHNNLSGSGNFLDFQEAYAHFFESIHLVLLSCVEKSGRSERDCTERS